ncbi:MAG TPA: hypothetical protein VFS77_10910 [Pyrinomonadaceae bacterium]|nr:hypothetical protein [Pyrinomonadaceae bacterium]
MLKFVLFVFLFAGAVLPSTQPTSLCSADEKIIFNCLIKENAKTVSLCSSRELTKERGYLQYRFGRPGKVELEFPKSREQTQKAFKYSHYFRAQVDLTEISFTSAGYQYSIVDDYNGEERPARSVQGVTVTTPEGKEVTLTCRGRAKADYSSLGDVFGTEEP